MIQHNTKLQYFIKLLWSTTYSPEFYPVTIFTLADLCKAANPPVINYIHKPTDYFYPPSLSILSLLSAHGYSDQLNLKSKD